jgi:1,2-dihydroxy-3-keto-5-methylthiopentene dioxygenase
MNATWLEDGSPVDPADIERAGLLHRELPTEPAGYQDALDGLKADRGYVTQDVVELSPETPNLPAIQAMFDKEHLHTDDEARFVLEGAGIFDVRCDDNRWMRLEVGPGDLLVVPQGRHHRFMLTDALAIRCVRLFVDPAGWVAHYR